MKKFKIVLYYCTVILPILNKIISFIKLINDLVTSNKEVIQARNDLVNLIKQLEQDKRDFNKTMEE